jgi:Protein of unknown function (DUF3574)
MMRTGISINSIKVMQKALNSLTITGLLFITPAYTNELTRAQSSPMSAKESTIIKDELYFGLSKPGGKIISEAEWQQFLNSVITPRFREGLTVVNAHGQYRNQNGKLIREKTKLVILIYERNATKQFHIQEVVAKYKQIFKQESVLRTTSNVKLSF